MSINWKKVGNVALDVGKAAIGFGGDLFGSMISGNFNSAEAQANRDWAERMSNTAHQREVKDLRAAGLNPILSATGGNGASSPVGGAATMTAPMLGNSAISGYKSSIESKLAQQQGALFNAQANKTNEEALTQSNVRDNLNSQTNLSNAQTALTTIQKLIADKDLKYYDKKLLVELNTKIATALAAQGLASAAQLSSQANVKNAETGRGQLKVNAYQAKTGRIEATQGNPFKWGADKYNQLTKTPQWKKYSKYLKVH